MKIFALLLILGVITNSTSFAGGPRKQRQMEEKDQKMEEENDNNGMDEEYIVHSGDRKNPEIEVEKEEFKFIEEFDPNSVYKEELDKADKIYTRLIERTQNLPFPVHEVYSQIDARMDDRGNSISVWNAVNDESDKNFSIEFFTAALDGHKNRNEISLLLNDELLSNPKKFLRLTEKKLFHPDYVLYPRDVIKLLCLLVTPSLSHGPNRNWNHEGLNQLKRLDLDFVSPSGAKLLKKADWRNLEVLRINVRSRDQICNSSKEILVPLTKIQIKREAEISYSVHYDTPTNMLPGTLVPHDTIELDDWRIIRCLHDSGGSKLLEKLFRSDYNGEKKPIEKMQSSVVSVARLGPNFNQYYDQLEDITSRAYSDSDIESNES